MVDALAFPRRDPSLKLVELSSLQSSSAETRAFTAIFSATTSRGQRTVVVSSPSDVELAVLEAAVDEVATVASAAEARELARDARALARRIAADVCTVAIAGTERESLAAALADPDLARRRFRVIDPPDRIASAPPVDLTLFAMDPTHGLRRDDLDFLAAMRRCTRDVVVVASSPEEVGPAEHQVARVAPPDAIEVVSRCQLSAVWQRIEQRAAARTPDAAVQLRRHQAIALILRLRAQLREQRLAFSTWLETSKRRAEQLAGWSLGIDHTSAILAPAAARDFERLRERLETERIKFLMAVKVELLEGIAVELDDAAPVRSAYRAVALTLAHELVLDAITRWRARLLPEIEAAIERARTRFTTELPPAIATLSPFVVHAQPSPPFVFRAEHPAPRPSLAWATDGMRARSALRRAALAEAREVALRLLTCNSRDVIEDALAHAHDEYGALVLQMRRSSRELADATCDAVRRVTAAREDAVPEPVYDLLEQWLRRLGELERGLAATP